MISKSNSETSIFDTPQVDRSIEKHSLRRSNSSSCLRKNKETITLAPKNDNKRKTTRTFSCKNGVKKIVPTKCKLTSLTEINSSTAIPNANTFKARESISSTTLNNAPLDKRSQEIRPNIGNVSFLGRNTKKILPLSSTKEKKNPDSTQTPIVCLTTIQQNSTKDIYGSEKHPDDSPELSSVVNQYMNKYISPLDPNTSKCEQTEISLENNYPDIRSGDRPLHLNCKLDYGIRSRAQDRRWARKSYASSSLAGKYQNSRWASNFMSSGLDRAELSHRPPYTCLNSSTYQHTEGGYPLPRGTDSTTKKSGACDINDRLKQSWWGKGDLFPQKYLDRNFSHFARDPDRVQTSRSTFSRTHVAEKYSDTSSRHRSLPSSSPESYSSSTLEETCVDNTWRDSSVPTGSRRSRGTNTHTPTGPVTSKAWCTAAGGDWLDDWKLNTSESRSVSLPNRQYEYRRASEILSDARFVVGKGGYVDSGPDLRAQSRTSFGYRSQSTPRASLIVEPAAPRGGKAAECASPPKVATSRDVESSVGANLTGRSLIPSHPRPASFQAAASTSTESSTTTSSEEDTQSGGSKSSIRRRRSLSAENYFLRSCFSPDAGHSRVAALRTREAAARQGPEAGTSTETAKGTAEYGRQLGRVVTVEDGGAGNELREGPHDEGDVDNDEDSAGDDAAFAGDFKAPHDGQNDGYEAERQLIPARGCWISQWEGGEGQGHRFKVISKEEPDWQDFECVCHPSYRWPRRDEPKEEKKTLAKLEETTKLVYFQRKEQNYKLHQFLARGTPLKATSAKGTETIGKKCNKFAPYHRKRREVELKERSVAIPEVETSREKAHDYNKNKQRRDTKVITKEKQSPKAKQNKSKSSTVTKSETEERITNDTGVQKEKGEPVKERKKEGHKLEEEPLLEETGAPQAKRREADQEKPKEPEKKRKRDKKTEVKIEQQGEEERTRKQEEPERPIKQEEPETPRRQKEVEERFRKQKEEKERPRKQREEEERPRKQREEEERPRKQRGVEERPREDEKDIEREYESDLEQETEEEPRRQTEEIEDLEEPEAEEEEVEERDTPKTKKALKESAREAKRMEEMESEINQNKKTETSDTRQSSGTTAGKEKKREKEEQKVENGGKTRHEKKHHPKTTNSAIYDAALKFFEITGMRYFAKTLLNQMTTLKNKNRTLKFYAPQRRGLYVTPQPYPVWIYPNDPLGLYKYICKIRGRNRTPTPHSCRFPKVNACTSCDFLHDDTSSRPTSKATQFTQSTQQPCLGGHDTPPYCTCGDRGRFVTHCPCGRIVPACGAIVAPCTCGGYYQRLESPQTRKQDKSVSTSTRSRGRLASPNKRSCDRLKSPTIRKRDRWISSCTKSRDRLASPCAKSRDYLASPCTKSRDRLASPCTKSRDRLGSPCTKSRDHLASPCTKSRDRLASPCTQHRAKSVSPSICDCEKFSSPGSRSGERLASPSQSDGLRVVLPSSRDCGWRRPPSRPAADHQPQCYYHECGQYKYLPYQQAGRPSCTCRQPLWRTEEILPDPTGPASSLLVKSPPPGSSILVKSPPSRVGSKEVILDPPLELRREESFHGRGKGLAHQPETDRKAAAIQTLQPRSGDPFYVSESYSEESLDPIPRKIGSLTKQKPSGQKVTNHLDSWGSFDVDTIYSNTTVPSIHSTTKQAKPAISFGDHRKSDRSVAFSDKIPPSEVSVVYVNRSDIFVKGLDKASLRGQKRSSRRLLAKQRSVSGKASGRSVIKNNHSRTSEASKHSNTSRASVGVASTNSGVTSRSSLNVSPRSSQTGGYSRRRRRSFRRSRLYSSGASSLTYSSVRKPPLNLSARRMRKSEDTLLASSASKAVSKESSSKSHDSRRKSSPSRRESKETRSHRASTASSRVSRESRRLSDALKVSESKRSSGAPRPPESKRLSESQRKSVAFPRLSEELQDSAQESERLSESQNDPSTTSKRRSSVSRQRRYSGVTKKKSGDQTIDFTKGASPASFKPEATQSAAKPNTDNEVVKSDTSNVGKVVANSNKPSTHKLVAKSYMPKKKKSAHGRKHDKSQRLSRLSEGSRRMSRALTRIFSEHCVEFPMGEDGERLVPQDCATAAREHMARQASDGKPTAPATPFCIFCGGSVPAKFDHAERAERFSADDKTYTVFGSSNPKSGPHSMSVSSVPRGLRSQAPTAQSSLLGTQHGRSSAIDPSILPGLTAGKEPSPAEISSRSEDNSRKTRHRQCPPGLGVLTTTSHQTCKSCTKSSARDGKDADTTTISSVRPSSTGLTSTQPSTAAPLTSTRRPCRPYSTVTTDKSVLNLGPGVFPTIGSTGYFSYQRYRQTLGTGTSDSLFSRPLSFSKYASGSTRYTSLTIPRRFNSVSKYALAKYAPSTYVPRKSSIAKSNILLPSATSRAQTPTAGRKIGQL